MRTLVSSVIVASLVLLAARGIVQGFSMPTHAEDFQWSPSRVFWSGRNPYTLWLAGNPTGEMILSQQPNYPPLLLVMLLPYALLGFPEAKAAWAVTNLGLLVLAYTLASRLYDLSGTRRVVGFALFLASRPTIHLFENGQHSLVILAAFVASIVVGRGVEGDRPDDSATPSRIRLGTSALLAGITYAKYSFTPSLATAYALRYGWGYCLVTIIPAVAALTFSRIWLGGDVPLTEFVVQPLTVATRSGLGPAAGDLLTVLQKTVVHGEWARGLAMVCCFALAAVAPAFSGHRAGSMEFWAFASVTSLSFVTHGRYDYVFYLFPALLALQQIYTVRGIAVAGLVTVQWWDWQLPMGCWTCQTACTAIGFGANMLLLIVIRSMPSPPRHGRPTPPCPDAA